MGEDLKIRSSSPPGDLPIYNEEERYTTSYFATTDYSDSLSIRQDVFGIKRFDRRQHMYVLGKTGVGKSKMIELLARTDIIDGHGVCVIDPHGDLVDSLLKFIPEQRADDVVLMDSTDMDFPICFNPIREVPPDVRHFVAGGLIETFRKQFGDQWSSRLEHVCRFTILALLEYREATVADMMKMLTDPKFRQKVIPHITDEVIRRFWSLEFAAWSERFDNEAIVPLVNRIGQFLSNPLVRHTFAQKSNKIDFDELMNTSKIILINLSKGVLGEENTELFGSLIITSIYQAAMRRAKIAESERADFYLYVDEFQNIATQTFLNLFSESRKYGLDILVSHQYLGQITPKMRDTIFGNVGTIIAFRLGAEDAERLNKEFAPVCTSEDLINLSSRQFVIKLLIDGTTSDPFCANTLNVESAAGLNTEKIIQSSRARYARPVKEVRDELMGNDIKQEQDDFVAPLV